MEKTYVDAVLDGDLEAVVEKLEDQAADAIMEAVNSRKSKVIEELNKG